MRLMPHDDVWLVSLCSEIGKTLALQAYEDLPDALDAVHEWALMLSDETELSPGMEAASGLIREVLAQAAVEEMTRLPDTLLDLMKADRLRAWYERQMREDR
jgi:hypothetical protein